MAYWWVNHKQTYRQEVEGGYIWSPKTRADGVGSHFYDNTAKVQPGVSDRASPLVSHQSVCC